jgi:hypothetical protein
MASKKDPKWQTPSARLPKTGQSDKKMRHIDGAIALATTRRERIEIVAADPALDRGKAGLDLVRLAMPDGKEIAEQSPARIGRGHVREIGALGGEPRGRSIGENRVDRDHIVPHRAITKRPAAAGIIARHAANGRPRRRRDIHGKP